MVSLKVHNILDYVIALVLVLSPFIFGFSDITAAKNIFLVLGFGLATYSLITKYYYCIARIIPVGVHMIFDSAAGVTLLAAPYLFDYRENLTELQFGVHVAMGVGAIGLVSLTKTRTEAAKTVEERRDTSGTTFSRPHRV